MTWNKLKEEFLNNYFPQSIQAVRQKQFFLLKQIEHMLVIENNTQFNALGQYVPAYMENDYLKMLWFEEGLLLKLCKLFFVVESKNYRESFLEKNSHRVRDGDECRKFTGKEAKDLKMQQARY